MSLDLIKESYVEYCENIYALTINYLKKNNNIELESLISNLTSLEDDIRVCENIDILNTYKLLLEQLVNKIEGIVNE